MTTLASKFNRTVTKDSTDMIPRHRRINDPLYAIKTFVLDTVEYIARWFCTRVTFIQFVIGLLLALLIISLMGNYMQSASASVGRAFVAEPTHIDAPDLPIDHGPTTWTTTEETVEVSGSRA